MLQSIIFALVTIAAFAMAGKQFLKIRRNILLGKDAAGAPPSGGGGGWRNVLLVAFGQKKMFKRPVPAIFHLFIYVAFLFTQVELIEILIDGFFGQHRFFADSLGGFYTFLISFIEVLSVLAFVATLVFLARRNLLRVPRFFKPEMNGWPRLDGNIILYLEILLLVGICCMNGAEAVLGQGGTEGYKSGFAISSWLGPALFGGLSEGTLHGIERLGWWLHILVVFGFMNYLPMSKHLHIFLAFPNTYFARQNPRGEMANMPVIQREVAAMMNPEAAPAEPAPEAEMFFGANDVTNLPWQHVLAAYTCTECGRCTAECPANQTGKKLSPRKIMMDVRDRAEEIGRNMDSKDPKFINAEGKYEDGKTLFDYISREEIHACTTCNACVEACPVLINPLDIILQLRRYEILMESAGPTDWLPLFNSLENSQAAWAVGTPRDAWTADL